MKIRKQNCLRLKPNAEKVIDNVYTDSSKYEFKKKENGIIPRDIHPFNEIVVHFTKHTISVQCSYFIEFSIH